MQEKNMLIQVMMRHASVTAHSGYATVAAQDESRNKATAPTMFQAKLNIPNTTEATIKGPLVEFMTRIATTRIKQENKPMLPYTMFQMGKGGLTSVTPQKVPFCVASFKGFC
jgi:hypothetical protein